MSDESIAHLAEPAVSDRSFQRLLLLVVALTTLAVMLLVGLAIFRFEDSATLQGQKTAVARQDCARRLSAEQTEVRDHRENLLAQGLLAVELKDPVMIAKIERDLAKAVKAVDNLPALQALVDRECPS